MNEDHGYSRYVRGCRCADCRAAKAAYGRAYRARLAASRPAVATRTATVVEPVDLRRLERLAQTLVVRMRDENPDANGEWWDRLTPSEQRAVAFIAAAAVPDDRPWSDLIAWTDPEGAVERRRRQWREAVQRKAARKAGAA